MCSGGGAEQDEDEDSPTQDQLRERKEANIRALLSNRHGCMSSTVTPHKCTGADCCCVWHAAACRCCGRRCCPRCCRCRGQSLLYGPPSRARTPTRQRAPKCAPPISWHIPSSPTSLTA